MNLFEEQAKAIQQVREGAKVYQFPDVAILPTLKLVNELRKQGMVIVHKPHKSKPIILNDDDLPPEAA